MNMTPLIALVAGTLLARFAGWISVDALDSWPHALRVGLAAMFVLTGLAHFGLERRQALTAMVPRGLPRPDLLVTITGVLEIAGAIGLLIPATARLAAWCLALLMLTMLPANVSAARRGLMLGGRPVTPLAIRLPMQVAFVAAGLTVALA
jgi:uncharacterized membrane protein